MANLTGRERARFVQEMFGQIAPRYDQMNRIMTAGQDVRWRREVIRRAHLHPDSRVLDLGAGTGDLAREALRQQPECVPISADFTLPMMQTGRAHIAAEEPAVAAQMNWSGADALQLPFPNESFDAVVSGFLLRNLGDVQASLNDQYRVLRPGGRWVAVDTTPPADNLLLPFIRLHLQVIIPALGRLIAHQGTAYQYLPDSTESFLSAERLAARLVRAGFQEVGFRRLMFGTIAIHWAIR